jgi:hypothetical protein
MMAGIAERKIVRGDEALEGVEDNGDNFEFLLCSP